jgi:hypothetical protein
MANSVTNDGTSFIACLIACLVITIAIIATVINQPNRTIKIFQPSQPSQPLFISIPELEPEPEPEPELEPEPEPEPLVIIPLVESATITYCPS